MLFLLDLMWAFSYQLFDMRSTLQAFFSYCSVNVDDFHVVMDSVCEQNILQFSKCIHGAGVMESDVIILIDCLAM